MSTERGRMQAMAESTFACPTWTGIVPYIYYFNGSTPKTKRQMFYNSTTQVKKGKEDQEK